MCHPNDKAPMTFGEFQRLIYRRANPYGFGPVVKRTLPADKPRHRPQKYVARRNSKAKPCGCDCAGCRENTYHHCLTSPCTRQRNRRVKAEREAEATAPPKPPKPPTVPKPRQPRKRRPAARTAPAIDVSEPMAEDKEPIGAEVLRDVWVVLASRGGKDFTLAAPDGQEQANTMAEKLRVQGWTANAAHIKTYRTDPRFHELRR